MVCLRLGRLLYFRAVLVLCVLPAAAGRVRARKTIHLRSAWGQVVVKFDHRSSRYIMLPQRVGFLFLAASSCVGELEVGATSAGR